MDAFSDIVGILLDRLSADSPERLSLRLVNKHCLRVVDGLATGLKFPAGYTAELCEKNVQRFELLRSLDMSQAMVYDMDSILKSCKLLQTIRCTLGQACSTSWRSCDRFLDLSIVQGHQKDSLEDLKLPISRLSIELSTRQRLTPFLLSHLQYMKIEGYDGARILPEDLQIIAGSGKLVSLILRHCIESVPDPLSMISKMVGLTALDISYNLGNAELSDSALSSLTACRALKDLDVSFTKITAAGLVTLTILTFLTRLAVNSCETSNGPVQRFSACCPHLKVLEIASSWELTELYPVSSSNFNQLANLDVSSCQNLEVLRDIPNLQELRASGVRSGPVQQISSFTNLTYLDISHKSPKNAVVDRTVEILATCLVGLQVFNMDGAHLLTDSGVISCRNLRSLRVLNIGRSGVTAVGVNALLPLTSLQTLKCKKCEFLRPAMCSGRMRSILQV